MRCGVCTAHTELEKKLKDGVMGSGGGSGSGSSEAAEAKLRAMQTVIDTQNATISTLTEAKTRAENDIKSLRSKSDEV